MHESGENYLETILVLKRRTGQVRSIDIARELGFSKPSVSRAVGILKENGFITADRNGIIELTDEGKKKAEGVYERHFYIKRFLKECLKVEENIAEEDACRMEHVISEETFLGLKKLVDTLS